METTKLLYHLFLQSKGVTTDSRQCAEGMMFFALKGERFNGNAYALQALEKGCLCAVVDDISFKNTSDKRIVYVENVLLALQQLARHHRRTLGLPVIGITGTNGKTTTKELVAAVLCRKFRTHYTQGNLNNQIGVPLTLLQLTCQHQLAVVEMGASHPGDIKELVDIAEPDFGIITNVGRAHLQGFGSFEGVIRTKGELYDFLRSREGSLIFLHNDNPHLKAIAQGLTTVRYGTATENEPLAVSGELISCNPFLRFRWQAKGIPAHTVNTHLVGGYNIDNALCAITVGRYFGVPNDDIDAAIEGYTPSNSRSQLIMTSQNTLIVDAYNANPTSMHASLLNFNQMESSNKVVIIGDMKELGDASAEEHIAIVQLLDECTFEKVWLVGQNFHEALVAVHGKENGDNNSSRYHSFASAEEVLDYLKANPLSGCSVLVKGSNSMRLSSLIPAL